MRNPKLKGQKTLNNSDLDCSIRNSDLLTNATEYFGLMVVDIFYCDIALWHPNLFDVTRYFISMPIQEASKWKDKGDELFDKGFFKESIKCFDRALELSPTDVDLWNNKGLALSNLGAEEKAIWCFNKAIDLSPHDTLAWINKGVALDDLGRHQEAIECFDTVIEIDPQDASAWSNKGVSFGLLGRFEKAIECFETAIKIDPLNAPAWYNKGMTLKVLNCDTESEIALTRAKELGYEE